MKSKQQNCSYVLITAARNEEAHIEKTIQSVVSQTILPKRWVIVSDGSTDLTNDIVSKYTKRYKWIVLQKMPEHIGYDFAAKAKCFNSGYQLAKALEFDLVGNLDADISFKEDYFESLLNRFSQYADLGVAGTAMIEADHNPLKDALFNENDVFGACQLFRRECFEQIGGYPQITWGGIDSVALRIARMNGWKTQSFVDKAFFHHRPMGASHCNILTARFNYGREDYLLGNHPLWELFRIAYQITRKPIVIGGLLICSGYCFAFLSRIKRPISQELMNFHRSEQIHRLKSIFNNLRKYGKLAKSVSNEC